MHFSPLSLITAAAILVLPQVTQANFDIYSVKWTNLGKEATSWQFFEAGDTGCDKVINTPVWTDSDDVSGGKMGVRCKGDGCDHDDNPDDIEQLEFHTGNDPLLHFTLYKDRGFTMVGLDGNTYGNCRALAGPDGDYSCWQFTLNTEGRRKFRCEARWSADDMNRQA